MASKNKANGNLKVKLMTVGIIIMLVILVIGITSVISGKVKNVDSQTGDLADIKATDSNADAPAAPVADDYLEDDLSDDFVDTEAPEVDNIKTPSAFNTPEEVKDSFMDCIKNNDMRKIYEMVYLEDKRFMSAEDIEYVLRRSNISHLIGNDGQFGCSSGRVYGGSATFDIDGYNDTNYQNDFTLKLVLDESNEWRIDSSIFAKSEVVFYCPVGVRLFLNELEVPTEFISKRDANYDYYTLHGVTYREWNTKMVSSSFGELNGKIEVIDDSDKYYNKIEDSYIEIPKEISLELFDEVSGSVKDIYTQVYQMMDNNAPAEDLNQFICSEKDYTYFEQWYQTAILNKLNSYADPDGEPEMLLTNVMILDIYQNPNVISYVYSDNTIVVNLIMHVRWNNRDNIRSNKFVTAAKMVKENGQWLLSDIKPNAWIDFTTNDSSANNVGNW